MLAPIIVFATIILIHELGHFIAALLFKVPVKELSIGMGPTIFSYNGKTKYSIRALPLGGYVNIDEKDVFAKLPLYKKIIILLSGILMNFLLSFTIIFSIFYLYGAEPNKIIQKDDQILEINGEKIEDLRDLKSKLKKLDNFEITIKREGKILNLKIKDKNEFSNIFKDLSLFKAFLKTASFIWKSIIKIIDKIYNLVKGKVNINELSGPIGIINIINKNSDTLIKIFMLIASISLSVGFFNLLPLPLLDGGKIVLVILEHIGVKINDKIISFIGIIFFVTMTIYIGRNDIQKIRNNIEKSNYNK